MRSPRRLALLGAAVLGAAWLLLRWPPAERASVAPAEGLQKQRALLEGAEPGGGDAAEASGLVPPEEPRSGVPTSAQLMTPGVEEQEEIDPSALRSTRVHEPLASLRVEVVDVDGAVVPGAIVWIHRTERCTTDPYRRKWDQTEGNGIAVFKSLAAGEWHVVAESPGLDQAHVEAALRTGEESRVLVRLEPGLVIAGRVRSGAGFESISVNAISEIGCGARSRMVSSEDGTFRMEGLCPGPWRCYADILGSDVGLEPWGGHGEDVLSSIDSVPAASAPVLVTESREDLELVLPRSGNLSGRFIGLAVGRRRGVAINRDTQHRYALRFDGERFSALGLGPGTYMIVGTDMEGWGVLDGVQVEEESAVRDLEIRIEPAARLSIVGPSEEGRVSILLHGIVLPEVDVDGSAADTYLVPVGQLQVEMRLAGSRQAQTVDAIGGQALTLTF